MNKELDSNILAQLEADFDRDPVNRMAMNAVNKTGVKESIRDYELERRVRYSFSIEIEAGEITNQKQSGRCWMFAALNIMRVEIMKKLKLKNMELVL